LLTARLSPAEAGRITAFPAGAVLTPGHPSVLTIEFTSVTELATKILQLGAAISKNLDQYVATIEPFTVSADAEKAEEELEQMDMANIRDWMDAHPG